MEFGVGMAPAKSGQWALLFFSQVSKTCFWLIAKTFCAPKSGTQSEVIDIYTGSISNNILIHFVSFEGIPFRRGYLLHGVPGRLVEL